MTTQLKVSLGIFWDIENCCIPLRKTTSSVVKGIREYIQSKHPECGFPKEFRCVCDSSKLNPRVSEGLNNSGVDVLHVNSMSKNAADDKLAELIDSFVDKFGSGSVLVVMTSDINFRKPILKARQKDLVVVLIHGKNCSQDLKNLVNETYLFDEVTKGAENANQDNTIPLMPAHLKVFNLPNNVPIDSIRGRLSKLSENCGGKVGVINDGSALIRFACQSDAQRALQRMNGEDCFGCRLKLLLIEGDPNQAEQSSLSETLIQTPVSSDCKSVIRGLETKKDQNLTKIVRKIVADWKDNQINPNLIVSVERNTKKAQEDGKVTLFVTAVSAEATKKLINGAKQYINPSHGIKWDEFRELKSRQANDKILSPNNENNNPGPKLSKKAPSLSNLSKPNVPLSQSQPNVEQKLANDDCKSVIRGLETKKDQNVAKVVRKLVSSWNDSQINQNFIVSVDRNTKQAQEDGKVTLFVTATNSESSRKLVDGAKKYINPNEKIKWTHYISRPNRTESVCSDESIASGSSQVVNEKPNKGKKNKLTEAQLKHELSNIRLNMKLFAGFLYDSTSDVDYLNQLYVNLKSMQTKYIAKYVNTFQSPVNKEIQDINTDLEGLFTIYEKKFGKHSLPAKNQSTSVKTKNMSVILGFITQEKDDVLQVVRNIISRWNDSRISPDDITAVSRDTKWKSRDGKAMLFVTAKNRNKNKLIIQVAKSKFNNNEAKLLWNKYDGKNKAN